MGNSKAMTPQSFRGGMPYSPDVEKLKEAYPVQSLVEGRLITHEEIEEVIKYKPKTQRYYGVVNSWTKKIENDHDIIMEWDPGIGLKVLSPHERLSSGECRIKRGIKATSRGVRFLGKVPRDRLDEDGKKRYDHVGRVSMILKTALAEAKKSLPIEVPANKSLPKKAS